MESVHVLLVLALISSWLALCSARNASVCLDKVIFDTIFVEFGTNLGSTVPRRTKELFNRTGAVIYDYDEDNISENSLILSLGNTSTAKKYFSDSLANLPSESYQVKYQLVSGSLLIVSDGNPLDLRGFRSALDIDSIHYGAVTGLYAVLELLGFSFLHPLDPIIPMQVSLCSNSSNVGGISEISITESPYWPKRTWHVHTQHPLEFTDVLNGYDIPMFPMMPDSTTANDSDSQFDRSCTAKYCESWEDMYATLPGLFEWMVANRQNRIEVLLLGSEKWDILGNYTSGIQRQNRLRKISKLCHEFGVLMGADVPIANRQQHGWKMINLQETFEQQTQDINDRVDWVFNAGFDFISTESGLSEATKPSCDLMLSLFEVFTKRASIHWRRESTTKVHCSTDQFCDETDPISGELKYPDPRTGEPINFNFLPHYAPIQLGVMPHTVQVYSFDDPSANAYGNENFSYVSDYMTYEAQEQRRRSVQYYGETAYWVNVDVDVPLFMPLTGQRRLYDLRRTARLELEGNFKIDGQMNFESGWEFGYHLANAVTARAVWNPHMDITNDWEAFSIMLHELFDTTFGLEISTKLISLLLDLSVKQADVLIYGRVNGEESVDLEKLSGHGYMSGSDTWVDLERAVGVSITQPDKVHLQETDDPLWADAVAIIKELDRVFTDQSVAFTNFLEKVEPSLAPQPLRYLKEYVDCVSLLAGRAAHNNVLYTAQDLATPAARREALLLEGRNVLTKTQAIMDARVAEFRVPEMRIAGWRQSPTVYDYGYVWAASTLYYMWRDQGITEGRSLMASVSPCYLNRIEAIELVIGYGKVLEQFLRLALKKKGQELGEDSFAALFADCVAPPLKEFQFPRDL